VILLFLVLDLVFLRWVLVHFQNWGFWDWDYQQTLLEAARTSLFKYHQLPLWNPFICGGSSLAGNPLNHAWGPCFIPILLFGTIIGIKVCIMVYLLIGQCGMFLLARHLGLTPLSAFLSAALFTFGGIYAQRLTHGHFEWIAVAWFPFIVLIIHKNLKSFRKIPICLGGLILAFIFMDGGPYQFALLGVFLGIYTVFLAAKHKNLRPPATLLLIFLIGMSLASIKLFPVYETVQKYPRGGRDLNFYGAPFKPTAVDLSRQMLVSRDQSHRPAVWMPYILNVSGYVGWVPLILVLAGMIMTCRRNWPLIVTLAIVYWIMLGSTIPWNLWGLLHKLPGLSMLFTPSRFNIFVLFALALLSGEGLRIMEERLRRIRWARLVPMIILGFILFDLIRVNGDVFKVGFNIPPIEVQAKDDFKQYGTSPYISDYIGRAIYRTFPNWRSGAFPAVLENRGVVYNYRSIGFFIYAKPMNHPEYQGEAWITGEKAEITALKITPNRIHVETNGLGNILCINQNYDSGWKIKGEKPGELLAINGLIAARLSPGEKDLELVFRPKSFQLGAVTSLLALLILLAVMGPQVLKNIRMRMKSA